MEVIIPLSKTDKRAICRENKIRGRNKHTNRLHSPSGVRPNEYRMFLCRCIQHAEEVGDYSIMKGLEKRLAEYPYSNELTGDDLWKL